MNSYLQPSDSNMPDLPRHASFNFYRVLSGRVSSPHTHRAYARWVDTFLADAAGLQPTTGDSRQMRMEALPLHTLLPLLNPSALRAWLGQLASQGHSKQGLNQARAAIVTLSELLAEAGWLDDYISAAVGNVRIPRAEEGQRPGRWLSVDQIKDLMHAGVDIATSENQAARNRVIMNTLCTMALRREELASARWGDLGLQNARAVLLVHGKGRKAAYVDIPKTVLNALSEWRGRVPRPDAHSALVRRVWRGGRIDQGGLTTDAIWRIVNAAAEHAGLGHVAPHDLRRSIAGSLQASGVTIDTISRLLRHANVAVTERYLSKLPQQNEGAILMADLLDLE
jgi:integrase